MNEGFVLDQHNTTILTKPWYQFKIPKDATLSQIIDMINTLELRTEEGHPCHNLIKKFGWELKKENFENS